MFLIGPKSLASQHSFAFLHAGPRARLLLPLWNILYPKQLRNVHRPFLVSTRDDVLKKMPSAQLNRISCFCQQIHSII